MKEIEIRLDDGRIVEAQVPDTFTAQDFPALRQRILSKIPEATVQIAPQAPQVGAGEAFAASAGRELAKAKRTARKAYRLATGQYGEPIREIEREAAEEQRLFDPLEQQQPVAAALGGMLPYMATPAAMWATPARAFASGAGLGLLSSEGDPTAAAMGGAGGILGQRLGSMFRPSPGAQQLMAEGIQPSLGQGISRGPLGRTISRAEEALQSVPLLGDAIIRARTRAQRELTDAALQRAVPKGEKLQKGIPVRDAINNLEAIYDRGYSKIFGQRKFTLDAEDMGTLRKALDDPRIMATQQQRDDIFNNAMEMMELGRRDGRILGETVKDVESEIRARARDLSASADPFQRHLGRLNARFSRALSEWRNRQLSSEQISQARELDRAYANFKRVQRASTMLGAEEGSFTPAQLQNAVKAMEKSKARFARGQALMQDLSETGKSILTAKLPESGTAPRLFMGGGALGGGYFLSPEAAMTAGTGAGLAWLTQPRWVQAMLLRQYPGVLAQTQRGGGVLGAGLSQEVPMEGLIAP